MEEKTKALTVTASNGVQTFSETARPYSKASHHEQRNTCIVSIHNQMKEAGVYEARNSYKFYDDIS